MDVDYSTPRVIPPFRRDVLNPLLFDVNTQAVTLTSEQERLIREVLLLASSDTRFAQKAADALRVILSGVATSVPTITSVSPATKVTNSAQFRLTVTGTGYGVGNVIYLNGNAVPTLVLSPTQIATDITTVGIPAGVYTVNVRTANGLVSNSSNFTVTTV